jgi:predicted transposase/invertase (TIGR01784 family)
MNKGIAKGREEGRADVARNLKKKGMSISDIADVTGFTEEEINAL